MGRDFQTFFARRGLSLSSDGLTLPVISFLILFNFFVEPGNVWNSHIGVESHDSVYQLPPHFTASPRIVRGKIRNMKRGSFSVVCMRHGLVSSLFIPVGDPFGVTLREGNFWTIL